MTCSATIWKANNAIYGCRLWFAEISIASRWWNEWKNQNKKKSNSPNAISLGWRWSIVVCVGGRYDWHAWFQWRWRNCHCSWWFIDDNIDWHRCVVRTFAHRCRLTLIGVIRRFEFSIQNDFMRFGRLHRLLVGHLKTMRFRHTAEWTYVWAFAVRHFHWLAWQYRWRHVIETVRFDEWLSCRWTGKTISTIGRREFRVGLGQLTHVSHHFGRRWWRQWIVLIHCVHIVLLLVQWWWWWRQIWTRYSKQRIFWRTLWHPIVQQNYGTHHHWAEQIFRQPAVLLKIFVAIRRVFGSRWRPVVAKEEIRNVIDF